MFNCPARLCLILLLLEAAMLAGCSSGKAGTARGKTPAAVVKRAQTKGLVDVKKAVPGARVDLRYTTAQNVTGQPLYPRGMPCLLRASTAAKLQKAQRQLEAQGYGLCIWDAWRPLEAHERLYQKGRDSGLFVNPGRGWSRHCGGVSVDATLVDAKGVALRMPTFFDEDLAHAASGQQPTDVEIRRNLQVLHRAMREAGFAPLPGEWWHFDDLDFLYHPVPALRARDVGLTMP